MKKSTLILSILLTLIATVLWSVGSWRYYTCRIKNTCNNTKPQTTLATVTTPATTFPPITLPTPVITTTLTDSDNDGLSDDEEKQIGTNPQLKDTDHDGIPDNEEVGTDLEHALDTDKDGIIDALDEDDDNDGLASSIEVKIGTSPLLSDTDNDGINDLEEVGKNPLQPLDTDDDKIINALDTDDDDDGLITNNELLLGTNPLLADSDSDGITDSQEIGELLDKPLDTDKDGIIDALDTDEVLDQDGDGLTDELEIKLGSDINNVDSDDDGINDNEEIGESLQTPLDSDSDGILNIIDPDDDNDKLSTRYESEIGTNPLSADTDGDGLDDKQELAHSKNGELQDTDNDGKIDPVDSDDDNDGLSTLLEINIKTNPLNKDSDNDGISDLEEVGSNGMKPLDIDNDGIIDALDSKSTAKPIKNTRIVITTPDDKKPESTKSTGTTESKPEQVASEDKQPTTGTGLSIKLFGKESATSFQPARLYFPFASAQPILKEDTSGYLKKVIAWMKKSPNNKVTLTGHTDNIGSAQENLAVGIKRVMIIRELLIEQGAPFQQIDVISRGETEAIAENTSESGRFKNRRVEIAPAEF